MNRPLSPTCPQPQRRRVCAGLAGLWAGTALPAWAADAALARQDRRFVDKATADGMAEVELGKLAQTQAASDEVKRFGEHMVQDHSRAGDELGTLATGKGVKPPAELPREHRRHYDRLAKLNGAEFDRAYMRMMVDDHRKAVSLFESQSRSGHDADLRAFASRTLPTLQQHLQAAQALNTSVGSAR